MQNFIFFIALLFPLHVLAQDATIVSTPEHIVVDSKDNIFVTRKYGLVKITPDGTITNLSKKIPGKGLDRVWHDLIIDSKDSLFANDGNVLFKIVVSDDNVVTMKKFAGQEYTYKLENGRIAPRLAGASRGGCGGGRGDR